MGAGPRWRVATRGSALAQWQARRVIEHLDEPAELVIVSTTGDERADTPIHAMGGTGVFVKEVELAVIDRRADFAVHSAKDLSTDNAPELALVFTERADPRDALVGSTLDDLPTGGRVATGSVRRRAQLAALRPDLSFAELRGSMETRLTKASGYDAIVVAAAALDRLDRSASIAERLHPSLVLPQVAQGALAVQCRRDDAAAVVRLGAMEDATIAAAVHAERAFLGELGGGCNLPCGALAQVVHDEVLIDVVLASLDGRVVLRASASGPVADPARVGVEAARRLLDEHGGRLLLEDVA